MYKMYLDQFGPVTAAQAVSVRANKAAGFFRYLGYHSHPEWGKGLSTNEREIIHAHGLGIGLNWEGNPTTPLAISTLQAQRDGHDIVTEVDYLSAPNGVGVWTSIDFDIQPADFKLALAYYEAIYKETGDRVALGAYAKAALLEFLKKEAPFIKFYWEPAAWANNIRLPWVDAFQARYNVRMAEHSVDVDNVQSEAGIWLPPGVQRPVDPPKPVDKPSELRYRVSLPNLFTNLQHATKVAEGIAKLGVAAKVEEA